MHAINYLSFKKNNFYGIHIEIAQITIHQQIIDSPCDQKKLDEFEIYNYKHKCKY